jgi:hypothetical protein
MGEKRKARITNSERSGKKEIFNPSFSNICLFFFFRKSKREKKTNNSVLSSASNDEVCLLF